MRLRCNTKQLVAFANKVSQAVDEAKERERKALLKVARQYLQAVKAATPVDSGDLLQQWDIDNSNLDVQIVETTNGYYIDIVNNTPYASWVEKGHRAIPGQFIPELGKSVRKTTTWVMGRFFVRKTENLFQNGIIDTVVGNELEKWIVKVLK